MHASVMLGTRQDDTSVCTYNLRVWVQGKLYDSKTDVWALGCVLYELCSLKKAFEAGNLGAITVKIMRYVMHMRAHTSASYSRCVCCIQLCCHAGLVWKPCCLLLWSW